MFHRLDDIHSARAVFDALKYPSVVSWNCILRSYIKLKRFKEALHLFRNMLQKGNNPNRVTFLTILGACTSPKNLVDGKWIHAYIYKHRMLKDISICNCLITMYSRCGDLKEAVSIFKNMQNRTVVSWNAMIAAHCKHGNRKEVLDLFDRMQMERMQPDQRTFVGMLSVFNSPECLAEGKELHNTIIDHGFHRELIVANALINMYSKCGSPDDAFMVFRQMETHDVISWTAMIEAYAESGRGREALEFFYDMQDKGVKPNRVTFVSALGACASLGDAEEGRAIHFQINSLGVPIDVYLGNALIYMYEKGCDLTAARSVFDEMHVRDSVSWTIMLHAYASSNHAAEALELFRVMQEKKIELDKSHFISALDACGLLSNLEVGKELHEQIFKSGLLSDTAVGNALMCMYGRCRALNDACAVFENMHHRDVVSWNAMINIFANLGHSTDAFSCFSEMQAYRVLPNKLTFLALLSACTTANALLEGKTFHRKIVELGCDREDLLVNALIRMYGQCGAVEDALAVFDHLRNPPVSAWNFLIGAYCNGCNGKGALNVFRRMQNSGREPNKITFLHVLKACAMTGVQDYGKTVHELIKECGWGYDVVVGGALINMYSKFRDLEAAKEVFENMEEQNVVSWTAMIDAYANHGYHKEAVRLLESMKQSNCEPNQITLASVLGSCVSPVALEDAISVHSYIIELGLESDTFVGNTLVGTYGRCQAIDHAYQAFHRIGEHDVVSWTALMSAYLRCHKHEEVLQLFQYIQKDVQPNRVTFICAVKSCTYMRDLAKGKEVHAKIMESSYNSDIILKQSLIDMYHSCGAYEELYSLTS
ncbi:hypothetical protein KP509_36G036400 [Ceratopteris richardii]|nr:hypothetical protein KP509_36G036400 [Ceratopteris richardii]